MYDTHSRVNSYVPDLRLGETMLLVNDTDKDERIAKHQSIPTIGLQLIRFGQHLCYLMMLASHVMIILHSARLRAST